MKSSICEYIDMKIYTYIDLLTNLWFFLSIILSVKDNSLLNIVSLIKFSNNYSYVVFVT